MGFKIDWASLIVGRKFTFFALFYFLFEGNFQVQALGGGGGLYLEGRFNGGFFALRVLGGSFEALSRSQNVESPVQYSPL